MLKTTVEEPTSNQAAGILARWNELPLQAAAAEVLACSGSWAWACALAAQRPIATLDALLASSDRAWSLVGREDWQQAFDGHPRLGETHAKSATEQSLSWSRGEQSKAQPSAALRQANALYEEKFGRIFLFCASGRTEAQILAAMEARMHNAEEAEWRETCAQQQMITGLRLAKWLESKTGGTSPVEQA